MKTIEYESLESLHKEKIKKQLLGETCSDVVKHSGRYFFDVYVNKTLTEVHRFLYKICLQCGHRLPVTYFENSDNCYLCDTPELLQERERRVKG